MTAISRPTSGRRIFAPIRWLIALVVGMDGDRRVAEHRLRPRRGDGQHLACLLARVVDDGIVEIIEMAVRVLVERLAQRGHVERRAIVAGPFERAAAFDLHTSRSEIAVWNFGSQLTRRLS